MYILNKTKSEAGQYPALETWPGLTAPAGYYWWPDSLDRTTFDQYQGFVELEVARGTVVSCAPNQPAFEAWQAAASAAALPARKLERIAESKQQLADYLLAHPLQWTDGQYYAITAEKQQQLTGKIMSATLAAQTGTGKPDSPGLCHRRPGHQPGVLPTGPRGGHAGSVYPGSPGGHPGGL